MTKRNPLFILATVLVVVLVAVIAWLVTNFSTPPAPSRPPENTSVATIPAVTVTPKPTLSQPKPIAPTETSFSDNAPTSTSIPAVVYLEPSGMWRQFTDETAGYSFEYPDNWFTLPENVGKQKGVAVRNSSPDQVNIKGSEASNPNKIKIVIFQSGEMGTYNTLDEYVAGPHVASTGQNVTYLKSETSPRDYQVLWQQEASTEVFLIAYISDGNKVFRVSAAASSKYVSVVDHIVASFIILESTQGSPSNPSLVTEYLAPDAKSLTYSDPQYGFSFQYPANWFISQTSKNAIALTNFSLSQVEKSTTDPWRFRLDLYVGKSIGDFSSLKSFVDAQKDPNGIAQIMSERSEILPNGNEVVWQELELQNTNRKTTTVYISDGNAVYELYGPSSASSYISVLEDVVASLLFP